MRPNSPHRFLFDQNVSERIAHALNVLEFDVQHVKDIEGLGEEATDEEILAYCETNGACVVTRDLAIRRRPAFRAAIRSHKVGAFFVGGKERSGLEMVRQIITAFEDMIRKSEGPRPFIFIVRPRGGKLERLPFD